MFYIIARSFSRSGSSRPTFQHILGERGRTLCNRDMSRWSATYQDKPISTEMLCKQCVRVDNKK